MSVPATITFGSSRSIIPSVQGTPTAPKFVKLGLVAVALDDLRTLPPNITKSSALFGLTAIPVAAALLIFVATVYVGVNSSPPEAK